MSVSKLGCYPGSIELERQSIYIVCVLIFSSANVQSWKVDVQTPEVQLIFQCDADVNLTRGPSYSS